MHIKKRKISSTLIRRDSGEKSWCQSLINYVFQHYLVSLQNVLWRWSVDFLFLQVNCWLAGLLLALLEGTGASPGWPRTTWAFPTTLCRCQVSWDIASSPQADGQAKVLPSSKDPLTPIGRDTWRQLSITTHKCHCPACPLQSTLTPSQNWALGDQPFCDPLKDLE